MSALSRAAMSTMLQFCEGLVTPRYATALISGLRAPNTGFWFALIAGELYMSRGRN